ncbi:hypothetical protein V6N13_045975 [Hibiscus sabdariffa]|uniref:Uncharacterized protein n=2 Tax=Hibiscus sabdariffa TaxID=183260 RepID=A0ABR2AR55_9ROSI
MLSGSKSFISYGILFVFCLLNDFGPGFIPPNLVLSPCRFTASLSVPEDPSSEIKVVSQCEHLTAKVGSSSSTVLLFHSSYGGADMNSKST